MRDPPVTSCSRGRARWNRSSSTTSAGGESRGLVRRNGDVRVRVRRRQPGRGDHGLRHAGDAAGRAEDPSGEGSCGAGTPGGGGFFRGPPGGPVRLRVDLADPPRLLRDGLRETAATGALRPGPGRTGGGPGVPARGGEELPAA